MAFSWLDPSDQPALAAGAQLPGHLAPCLAGMGAVGLVEGLPDRGGDDGVLGVAQPMNATPLPGCLEDAGDGGLETGMGRGGAQNGPVDRFAAEG